MDAANYLSFKENLSQIWFNKIALVLAIACVKLYLFHKSLLGSLTLIQLYTSTLITYYNDGNATLQEIPQKYNQLTTRMMISSINTIKEKSLQWLLFVLIVVKALISFFIDLFLGTFICLLNGFLSGAVSFMVDLLDLVFSFINDTIHSATELVSKGVNTLNDIINTLIDGVNLVASFFNGKDAVDQTDTIKQINLSLSKLDSIQIPDSVMDEINSFQLKVPNLDDVKDRAMDLMLSPLTKLATALNNLVNYEPISVDQFNNSVTTSKSTQLDPHVLDEYYDHICNRMESIYRSMLICLLATIVVVTIFLIIKDFFKWKRTYKMFMEFQSISYKNEFDFLNTVNVYSNDIIYHTRYRLGLDNEQLWILSYLTSPNSLMLLGLGVTGLFIVLLQFLLLRVFLGQLDKFPYAKISSEIAAKFTTNSETFSKNTNNVIAQQQSLLNKELLGSVKNATTTFSESINEFIETLNNTVIEPFSSTPFEKPISTVVYCVLTRKLMTIESGLAWISDNLVIKLPELPTDIKNMEAIDSFSLDLSDISDFIGRLESTYKAALRYELFFSAALAGLWVFQVVVGLIIWKVKKYLRKDELKELELKKQKYLNSFQT